MFRLVFWVVIFFVAYEFIPALLKQYIMSRNPLSWATEAGKAIGEGARNDNADCLKRAARQYGVGDKVEAACKGKTGADYIDCMKNFLLTSEDVQAQTSKDPSRGCAGISTQDAVGGAPGKIAWARFCGKIPWYVPGFLKTWIQCPANP